MSRVNPVYLAQAEHYAAQHAEFAGARPDDPSWLIALRAEALAGFTEQGFPHTSIEEWRSTNTAPIARLPFERAGAAGREFSALDALDGMDVEPATLVNGTLLSRGETGARVESLADLRATHPGRLESLLRATPAKDRSFVLLNTAFVDDGAVVVVPKDTALEKPVYLLVVSQAGSEPTAVHPRIVIDAEPGSQATVILDYVALGEAPILTNGVTDVSVGANAGLSLVVIQRGGAGAFTVDSTTCRVARDGRFDSHVVSVGQAGSELIRNDLDVVLTEEGAHCSLRGLFIGTGSSHIDNHTSVDHAMPHGTSRELYKGVLADASHGVFRGMVIVRPDAQKTDATQSNPNLLIGRGAEIDTKPQLEIYADDVKCSHGSTIGQLDENALFYLRSRGIGKSEARDLLTRAFANEITEGVPGEDLAFALGTFALDALQ